MINTSKRTAFSLVELMIVVAVTSVLISLVMPMYKAEKDRQLGNACFANLKTIGVAMKLYGTDWNGKFPNAPEGGVSPKCYLAIAMESYVSYEVFRCAADTGDALVGGSGTPYSKGFFYSSFAWPVSYSMWVNGLPMNNPVPATGIPSGTGSWVWRLPLSRRPVLFDHRPWHAAIKKSSSWVSVPGLNSVLYCDGHVGSRTYPEMLAVMVGSGTSEPK